MRRNPTSALLAVSLVVLAAAVGSNVWKSELINHPTTKGIAVLPFANLSQEPGSAYFADGIQNEILTKLAAIRDLKVISRTSTAKYQSKPEDLKTVAQELGVSTILEGAVQRAGDKVRVNVQLIDARTDTHLWAKSYDRDFKDVLVVESEVSQQIADALRANLSPRESQVLSSVRTHDTEAYDLFLRGEYELHQAESSLTADANPPGTGPLDTPEAGLWQREPGSQNYSFHDISYVYDENGAFAGSGVVTANVHLTSANSFTYSATIQFFDADGNLLFSGCGRATGTRFE